MDPIARAKRPISMLAGPYGHPIHPALVAIPIGAWAASLGFDAASRVVEDPVFLAQGSRWLIAIGLLGAVAAALVGFLDLLAIPTGTTAFRVALVHMSINLAVTAAYGVNFALRDGSAPVPWAHLLLSLASMAALAVSGYLGGKLAYRFGVRVADERDQAAAYRTTTPEDSHPKGSL